MLLIFFSVPLFFNVPLRVWTFMASALETLKTEFMPLESCRVWTMTVIEKLQLTSYIVSFVLSFFHFVPVSLSQEYFGGRCILFTTGRWFVNTSNGEWPQNLSSFQLSFFELSLFSFHNYNWKIVQLENCKIATFTENPPTLTVSSWGRPSLCHYNIFIGMCSMIMTFAQVSSFACPLLGWWFLDIRLLVLLCHQWSMLVWRPKFVFHIFRSFVSRAVFIEGGNQPFWTVSLIFLFVY